MMKKTQLLTLLFVGMLAACEKTDNETSSVSGDIILPNNTVSFSQNHFGLGDLDVEASDEFDSEFIDTGKWDVSDSTWWTPAFEGVSCYWIHDRKNARINKETGMLELLHDHNGRMYTKVWLKSKKKYTEGYFEARIKMSYGPATNSAFWIFDGYTSNDTYDEVDIVESPNQDLNKKQAFTTNYHIYNYDPWLHYMKHPDEALEVNKFTDTFHTFAAKITKEEIIWYWNNNEIRREKNILHGTPMKINLSTGWFLTCTPEDPQSANYPHIMYVDYIRAFDLKE